MASLWGLLRGMLGVQTIALLGFLRGGSSSQKPGQCAVGAGSSHGSGCTELSHFESNGQFKATSPDLTLNGGLHRE